MSTDAVHLEHLRPDQVADRLSESAIVYVPIGCIEYHGPHLPMGVDGLTARAVCTKAAFASGGVVHPISYMANGCLDLPYTLTFPPEVVEVWARSIVDQLHMRGAQLVVLLTGHGPLDLIHLLKRVAASYEKPGAKVYGLCYLELNAARLDEPEFGEPTVIDHASTIETSWMLAEYPEWVDLQNLPNSEDAVITGVYGKNPRFTASAELGQFQQSACAELLAERCVSMLRNEWRDDLGDLHRFVDFVWPEPLDLHIRSAGGKSHEATGNRIIIENPGRASRYITKIDNVILDGSVLDLRGATITNSSVGEVGIPRSVVGLDPEHGIYVRRGQVLELELADGGTLDDPRRLSMRVELAGVRNLDLKWNGSDHHESVEVLDGEGEGSYIPGTAGKDSN